MKHEYEGSDGWAEILALGLIVYGSIVLFSAISHFFFNP